MLVRLPVLTIRMQWWTAGDALSDQENAQMQVRKGWQAACRGLLPPHSLKKIQEPLLLGPQFLRREAPKAMILPGLRVCVSKYINIWWLGENVGNVQFFWINGKGLYNLFLVTVDVGWGWSKKTFAYVNYGSYWTALIKYMIAGA